MQQLAFYSNDPAKIGGTRIPNQDFKQILLLKNA